jgi:hypothetical protein
MPTPSPPELSRDLQLRGLPAQRPLERRDPAALLGGQRAVLAGRITLHARLDHLIAPPAQQHLRDLVLAADLRDRPPATQRREHQLGLLLDGELPVLALVAQQPLPTR